MSNDVRNGCIYIASLLLLMVGLAIFQYKFLNPEESLLSYVFRLAFNKNQDQSSPESIGAERDLVFIGEAENQARVYIDRSDVKRAQDFVLFWQEVVIHDSNGDLSQHSRALYNANCLNLSARIVEGYMIYKDGKYLNRHDVFDDSEPFAPIPPGSLKEAAVQYVCLNFW